ncbi:MAG: MBL fold metallo-hydrolase [Bacteroidetes bacterium]|nr:MAG: MBL fold metallo-hydrolase [Bacteroidota bacterium]
MEIITLIENEVAEGNVGLKAEAGLSLFIKSNGLNILFDTGSSGAFADNALKLGVDLSSVDFVVISHAHFDHTGGLARFFAVNKTAKVYIRQQATGRYYYKLAFLKKEIGVDQKLLKEYADRFVFVQDDVQINEDIKIVTHFSTKHKLPSDSKHLVTKKENKLVPDDFAHEQMLVINEGDNVYCFTGCSHHGILNMVESVQLNEDNRLNVIGGFHMYNPITKGLSEKKEDVFETAGLFAENKQLDQIVTGHCTGKGAYRLLKGVLGDKLAGLHTGSRISI